MSFTYTIFAWFFLILSFNLVFDRILYECNAAALFSKSADSFLV